MNRIKINVNSQSRNWMLKLYFQISIIWYICICIYIFFFSTNLHKSDFLGSAEFEAKSIRWSEPTLASLGNNGGAAFTQSSRHSISMQLGRAIDQASVFTPNLNYWKKEEWGYISREERLPDYFLMTYHINLTYALVYLNYITLAIKMDVVSRFHKFKKLTCNTFPQKRPVA